jgi:hypothetical protein
MREYADPADRSQRMRNCLSIATVKCGLPVADFGRPFLNDPLLAVMSVRFSEIQSARCSRCALFSRSSAASALQAHFRAAATQGRRGQARADRRGAISHRAKAETRTSSSRL